MQNSVCTTAITQWYKHFFEGKVTNEYRTHNATKPLQNKQSSRTVYTQLLANQILQYSTSLLLCAERKKKKMQTFIGT